MNIKSSKLQDGTRPEWLSYIVSLICEYDYFTRCHFIHRLSMIVQMNIVLKRTVVVKCFTIYVHHSSWLYCAEQLWFYFDLCEASENAWISLFYKQHQQQQQTALQFHRTKIVKGQENPHYYINFQIINFLEAFGHSSCPEGDLAKECLICWIHSLNMIFLLQYWWKPYVQLYFC